MTKIYKPKFPLYIPPLEFVTQLFVWVMGGLLYMYLRDYRIYDFVVFINFVFETEFYKVMLLSGIFCLYKICNTFTAVSKLVIDYENRIIKIYCWLLWFFKINVTIKFDELSFFVREGVFILSGLAIGVHIYKNNDYIVKLVTKNGWKKNQIDEIVKDLLQITDYKMRKEHNLSEKRMLESLREIDKIGYLVDKDR